MKLINSSLTCRVSSRAFTLIELLTVIAIIGILAGIMIPVVGKVRESGRSAQCISNLREINTAINLYVNDHRDRLPGPCWQNQVHKYNQYTVGALSKFLSTYLPPIETASNSFTNEFFRCSSWAAAGATGSGALVLNIGPWSTDTSIKPFGQAKNPESDSIQPMTFASIAGQPLSRTWMLTDQDNPVMMELGWASQDTLPQKTIHGSSRNVMFYDGHVQKISDKKKLSTLLNP